MMAIREKDLEVWVEGVWEELIPLRSSKCSSEEVEWEEWEVWEVWGVWVAVEVVAEVIKNSSSDLDDLCLLIIYDDITALIIFIVLICL